MAKQITYTIDIDGEQRVLKTLADITKASQDIGKAMQKGLPVGIMTNNLNKVDTGLKKVAVSAVNTGSALRRVTGTTNQAGIALQNMNFVVRDSPFFFKDLQLGVLAVGNNINPLIDSFIRLKKEAVEVTKATGKLTTTWSLLRKSMMGGMGLSLAMSVLVTAFQAVVFSMGNAARAAKEAAEKTENLTEKIDELRASLQNLSSVRVLDAAVEKLAELRAEVSKFQFHAHLREEVQKLREEILALEKIVDSGTDAYKKNVRLVVDLVQATKTGSKGIAEFANANKLTKTQLNKLTSQLRQFSDSIFSMAGGLGIDVNPRLKALALEFGLLPDEVKAALEALNEFAKSADKVKDKTKKLISVFIQFNTALELMNHLMGLQGDLRGNLIRQRQEEMESWLNLAEAQDTVAAKHKEAKDNMRLLTTASNQLGSAIVNAMMTGQFAIDNMIKSILAAIAQMLILRMITNALFGGIPLAGGVAGNVISGVARSSPVSPSIPSAGQLNAPSSGSLGTVTVEGTLRANKNEFVAEFNKASEVFDNKIARRNVGRS